MASIVPTHGEHPAAMAAVVHATGTPLVDVTERTRLLLEELEAEATLPPFAPNDGTHLSAEGAERVAGLVAAGIRDLGLPLASALAR